MIFRVVNSGLLCVFILLTLKQIFIMAAIRKKEGKELPAISTASLPDIVFMLLFFFMVATVMRETELKVQVRYPQATELQKLEKKSLKTKLLFYLKSLSRK